MKIGCCVDLVKDGLLGAAKKAYSFGANTFMLYANVDSKEIVFDENLFRTKEAHHFMEKHNMSDVIVHAPFTINLASSEETAAKVSMKRLHNSLGLAASLKSKCLVLHPGSHLGDGERSGLKRIIQSLNNVLYERYDINIALETMSGQGTEIGSLFSEIAMIMDGVAHNERLKVCFDTCHVFSSGYDIVTDVDSILNKFDREIGIEKINVIHLNDSKFQLGSRKDRHENIGCGCIGIDALYDITTIDVFDNIPIILETPYKMLNNIEQPFYREEISMIRKGIYNEADL